MADDVTRFKVRSRAFVKPALIFAAAAMVQQAAYFWRHPPDENPFPWLRLVVVTSAGFVAIAAFVWTVFALSGRRQHVSVMASGLEAPDVNGHQAYCGWITITDARLVSARHDQFVEVSGRYLPTPLRIPLHLARDPDLVELVRRYAGDRHPLTEVLQGAGA